MNIFEKESKKLVYWQLLLVVSIILVPLLGYIVVARHYSSLFLIALIVLQVISLSIIYKFSSIWDKLLENQRILDEKEKDLRSSEMNLKAFFDSSQDAIIIFSPERKVIAFNKVTTTIDNDITHKSIEKGVFIDDFILNKERLKVFKYNFKKALANQKIKIIRPSLDGRRWHTYYYTPIHDNHGHIWAIALTVTEVTKEKLHEKELHKSEKMYRQILNAVEDHVLVKKEGSKYVWANLAFHDFYSMGLENFSKFAEAMFDDQEYEERYKQHDEHIFRTRESITVTEVLKNTKGEEQIFQTIKSPIIDAAGKVQMVVSTSRNITKQFSKEVELRRVATESQNLLKQLLKSKEELVESEKKLRLLADSSIEMVTLCTPKGEMLYLSPSTERLTGYNREELYSQNFADFFRISSINSVENQLEKNEVRLTHHFLTKKGQVRWFSSVLKYIYDEEGEVASLQTSSRDSTDRVLAEMALKSSESRFRQLFNSGYDGIFVFEIIDNKYIELLDVNKVICDMLGYSVEEFFKLGKGLMQIEKGLNEQAFKERAEIIKRDKLFTHEATFIAKSGREIPVEVIVTLARHEGKVVIQAVARDITERKKVAQSVKEKELAERSLQIKSDFLANMSHEIRTPMNGIIGAAQILSNSKLSTQQGILVKTIYESGKNMLDILNDILTLSKIEADKMTLNEKTFDFQGMITNIRQLFKPLLIQKKSLLLAQIDEGIPQYIKTDETKLLQVLTNLISNAIRFTEKGKITLGAEIIAENKKTDYLLKISISDTGKGISKAHQQHIFEKFYQVEEGYNTKNNEGTGLGLSICKGIVTLWGGEIEVESVENEGSTFWFTIPIKTGENILTPTMLTEHRSFRFNKLNVLLVEDKKINQEVARMMLESMDCTVAVAENGLIGLQLARENSYDLVVMDIFMPVMDGITATQKIKQEIQPPPIIIGLSANAMEEDSKRYTAQGMDDYLSKPIDLYILSEKIALWFPEKAIKEQVTTNIEKKEITEKGMINIEAVDKIRSLAKGSVPYLQNLYQSLTEDMENLLKDSYEALKKEDNVLITRNIHTVKGLSGTIGMTKLQEQTSSLYTRLKVGNFENLEIQLQDIEKAHLQSLPLLRQALGL
jgi:PAS domain S-box-containing protein